MIDAEERALMAESVGGALADAVASGGDVDAALAGLDWLDLLRTVAVSLNFRATEADLQVRVETLLSPLR